MSAFSRPWWVIGGWAVDSWLGRQSRDHPDVDIGIFRDDESEVFDHLADWHLVGHDTPDATHDERWDGHELAFPAHIHARHPQWPELDFNENERDGDEWIVSRTPEIRRNFADATSMSAWGLPTLSPDLVLWHKGRGDVRDRDHADFKALGPLLTDGQRRWLMTALRQLDPQHPWLQSR
jgi:Aminoglycoside-2''-adenylyltransferase